MKLQINRVSGQKDIIDEIVSGGPGTKFYVTVSSGRVIEAMLIRDSSLCYHILDLGNGQTYAGGLMDPAELLNRVEGTFALEDEGTRLKGW